MSFLLFFCHVLTHVFTYANTAADARGREGVCGDAGGLIAGSEGGRGAGVEAGRGGASEGGRGAGVEEPTGGASEEPHVETDVHVGVHAACMLRGEGGRGAVHAACMLRGASEEPHVETDVHVESVLLQLDEEGDFVSDVLER